MMKNLLTNIHSTLNVTEEEFSFAILVKSNSIDELVVLHSEIESYHPQMKLDIYALPILIPFCLQQGIFQHTILDESFNINQDGILFYSTSNSKQQLIVFAIRPHEISLQNIEQFVTHLEQNIGKIKNLMENV